MHKRFLRTSTAIVAFCLTTHQLVPHRANAMENEEFKNYRIMVRSTAKEAVSHCELSGDASREFAFHYGYGNVFSLKEGANNLKSFNPTKRIDKLRGETMVDPTLTLRYQAAVFEFSFLPNAPGKLNFYYNVVASGLVWDTPHLNSFYSGNIETLNGVNTGNIKTFMLLDFPHGIESLVGNKVRGKHTMVEIFDGWHKTLFE